MPINLTPAAVIKIADLLAEQGDDVMLRIYVQGGGCSGFQYGFVFDDAVEVDDFLFTFDGAKVVIDAMSIQYLSDASVDYVEELMGAHFAIANPSAKSTCGCGSSFGI